MDDLLVMYTAGDFKEENKDKFYPYKGNFNKIKMAKNLVIWQWPGSDREKRSIEMSGIKIINIDADNACVDVEGREWVQIRIDFNYSSVNQNDRYSSEKSLPGTNNENIAAEASALQVSPADKNPPLLLEPPPYQILSGWVFINDPENSDIPAFYPAPTPVKWSPDSLPEWPPPNDSIRPPGNIPGSSSNDGSGSLFPGISNARFVIILIAIFTAVAAVAAVSILLLRRYRKTGR